MKIYGIHIQTVEKLPCEYLMRLMPERYARSEKFLRKDDRLRSLGAGFLMHHVLGIRSSDLRYGKYGKPYVPGGIEFSISHGGNWAVLAADRHCVGVDIEPIRTEHPAVADKVLSANELHWMQQDPLPRFHILWTIKESIMKATGRGMQLAPAQFEVQPDSGVCFVDGTLWHTAQMLHDGCAVACACEHKLDSLVFIPCTGETAYCFAAESL